MFWHRIKYVYVSEHGVRTHGVHTSEQELREFMVDLQKQHRDGQYFYGEVVASWEVKDEPDVGLSFLDQGV